MADYLLSDSELYIMKVVWRSEEALSMQRIMELVNERYHKNWKHQTVSVFLGRIVKKKMLISKRQGRVFYYSPTMSEEEYRKKEVVKWVNALGDGRADVFVNALTLTRELSEEEKTGLRTLLEQ
jgi:predicted transcriptional regulator